MSDCPEGVDCGKIHELLDDILDEELAADVTSEVIDHLKFCPDCTLHVDSVKKVIRLFRAANATQELASAVKLGYSNITKFDTLAENSVAEARAVKEHVGGALQELADLGSSV